MDNQHSRLGDRGRYPPWTKCSVSTHHCAEQPICLEHPNDIMRGLACLLIPPRAKKQQTTLSLKTGAMLNKLPLDLKTCQKIDQMYRGLARTGSSSWRCLLAAL
ncbi:MAG: hypothetical protein GY748_00680 [Planctomycetaceae bacterium]|nr:hypothetical protein [Planctomycetaceae bacterium]